RSDRAGAGQRLHASRNVDAIAINIAPVDDDVTDVDADTEFDPAIFGNGNATCGNGTLDFDGTANGINRTWKFNQDPVTCSFDDTAPILRNLRINQFVAASLERRKSSFLVSTHQAAVTSNIGRENGSQPSFDPRLGHKGRPAPLYFELSLWLRARCVYRSNNVRFGSSADICSAKRYVRFTLESGHLQRTSPCPLWAKSGTSRIWVAGLQYPRGGGGL